MSERYITGCAAVHPDQRGGQHVAMACPGVLAIDDDLGIGVLVMEERSQFKNKARATELLDSIRQSRASRVALTAEDKEELRKLAQYTRCMCTDPLCRERQPAVAVLDRLIGGTP